MIEVERLTAAMLAYDSLGGVNVDLTFDLVPQSDQLAAELLETLLEGRVRFVEQEERWLTWDGTVFAEVLEAAVHELVARLFHALRDALNLVELQYTRDASSFGEADEPSEKSPRDRYAERWAKQRRYRDRLGMEAGQAAVYRHLKKRPGIAVSAAELDANPDAVVLADGVLLLSVLRATRSPAEALVDHDPSRLVTRRAAASLRGEGGSGWWDWYLVGSVPDSGAREYLKRLIGAALLGRPGDVKAVINLIGPTNSGKSVLIEVLTRALGSLVGHVDSQVFLKKRNEGPGYEAHEMRGRRLVATTEPGVGKQIDDELVKKVTGGDTMTTRTLRGKPVTWQPQCQLIFASNQPMRFDTADTALLRRIVPIEFPVSFARPEEVETVRLVEGEDGVRQAGLVVGEPHLREYLMHEAELRDALRWVIEGLLTYLEEGLGPEPEGVSRRRAGIAVQVDSVREWLEEAQAEGVIRVDGNAAAYLCRRPKELYTLYRLWCADGGLKEKSSSSFKAVLETVREVQMVRSDGPRVKGIVAGEGWPTLVVPPS